MVQIIQSMFGAAPLCLFYQKNMYIEETFHTPQYYFLCTRWTKQLSIQMGCKWGHKFLGYYQQIFNWMPILEQVAPMWLQMGIISSQCVTSNFHNNLISLPFRLKRASLVTFLMYAVNIDFNFPKIKNIVFIRE